jgi:hypothetical protein
MKKTKNYQEKSDEPTGLHTSVFIPCAGDQCRWNAYLGVPKQLVDIDGEPLLYRTVRCLKERGLNDIFIIGNNPKFAVDGVRTYTPQASRWIVETIKSTESLWTQRNIILLGDVWFSPESLDRVISTNAPIAVFGRKGGSELTGARWGEIFALVFRKTVAPQVSRVLGAAVAYADLSSPVERFRTPIRLWKLSRFILGDGTNLAPSQRVNIVKKMFNAFSSASPLMIQKMCSSGSERSRLSGALWRLARFMRGSSLPQPRLGLLWSFYYLYLGLPIDSNHTDDTLFYELDDFTEDFDYPVDYDKWMANRSSYLQRNS